MAKSTIGTETESPAKLSNTKWAGRPQKTTKVDDYRIISLVRKKTLTRSSQGKNTLEEVYHCKSL